MTDQLAMACERAAADGLLHGAVLAAGTCEGLSVLHVWGDASMAPSRKAMAGNAVFDVASVTKAVATASACGICIDQEELDPHAAVADYLPGVGGFGVDPIRVRDLATHTSGFDNRKFDHLGPDEMLVAMVETPAQWARGSRFMYSCRNYVLLGHLVERLAGMDLGSFCERHVFGPCGMSETGFGPLAGDLDRVVPTAVAPGTISDEQARHATQPIGNAGLFSTAPDLARFCRMILSGGMVGDRRVFGQNALHWLLSEQSPPGLRRRSFGWDMGSVAESPCRPASMSAAAVGHSGWTGQSVWIDPELGLFTIVLTNRTHRPGKGDNYLDSKRFRASAADLMCQDLVG